MNKVQHGLTLVELVISIVVVSIALTTVLGAMGLIGGHSSDSAIRIQAMSIAESYLEEITAKAYFDPDTGILCESPPPAANQRPNYDNVCDYQGILADNTVRNSSYTPIANLSQYSVAVSITPNSGAELNGLPAGDAIRIDIQVQSPEGSYQLTGYRGRY